MPPFLSGAAAVVLLGWLGVLWACFDPNVHQPWIAFLWVSGLVAWVISIWRYSPAPFVGATVHVRDAVPIVLICLLLSAAWLPFYDNWRWAWTGDSMAWIGIAREPAMDGLRQNILSLRGVDENFTYLHGLAFNVLLFVFEPTLFWHRVGKLTLNCLGLAAIYSFFASHLGRWWAAAVALVIATNYVWIWFSYVSYPHIDSYIVAYLTLLAVSFSWRHPVPVGPWLLAGMLGGLSIFFTQTAWTVVLLGGLALAIIAVRTRQPRHLGVYVISGVLCAWPVLLQLAFFLEMTTGQAKSNFDYGYLLRIFTTIIALPYQSSDYSLGIHGEWMRYPLGHLYLLGMAIALLAAVPVLRSVLRIPRIAAPLFALLLVEATLMTLTNNGYDQPSTKRTYHVLPLQAFFAVLPIYFLYAWTPGNLPLRRAIVAAFVVVLVVYAYANVALVRAAPKGMYGNNAYDGLIELTQENPDRRIVFFSRNEGIAFQLQEPRNLLCADYGVCSRTEVVPRLDRGEAAAACSLGKLLCHEFDDDRDDFDAMMKTIGPTLREVTIRNATELGCFECVRK